MNSFNDILDEIYNKVKQKSQYTKDFSTLLEYAVILWSEKIGFQNNINQNNIFYDVKVFSLSFWNEWRSKTTKVLKKVSKGFNYETQVVEERFPNSKSPLNQIIQNFINKLPLRSQKMNDIKFIVFLGLIITAVGFVVYLLNQQKTLTESQRSPRQRPPSDSYIPPAPIPQILILVVNALKKDCLDKIQNQDNKIQSEDCEKLYRATSFLWMGDKSELNPKLKDCRDYIAQQESEYDVYLVEIELPKAKEGFKQDAGQLSRIDAFRELTDLTVKISSRLKVSVYENTNVYTR
jgi:hypothetical protein